MASIIPTPECSCVECQDLLETLFAQKVRLLDSCRTYVSSDPAHEVWLEKLLSTDECVITRYCPLRKLAAFGKVCSEKVYKLILSYRNACVDRYSELGYSLGVPKTPLDRFNKAQIMRLSRDMDLCIVQAMELPNTLRVGEECCRYGNVEMMRLILGDLTSAERKRLLALVEDVIAKESFVWTVGADSGPWPSNDVEDYHAIAKILVSV